MPSSPQPSSNRRTPPLLPAILAAAVLVCLPLTASREGLRTRPYLDPAGIPTVCYGETELTMRVYSADECGAMLRQRLLKDYAPKVAACVPQLVDAGKANALGAFIDAAYNAGPAAVCSSRMAVAVRNGDLKGGCDGFSGWYVTARGKKLPGLVNRREAERKLCLKDAAVELIPVGYRLCVPIMPPPLGPRPTNKTPFPRRPDTA